MNLPCCFDVLWVDLCFYVFVVQNLQMCEIFLGIHQPYLVINSLAECCLMSDKMLLMCSDSFLWNITFVRQGHSDAVNFLKCQYVMLLTVSFNETLSNFHCSRIFRVDCILWYAYLMYSVYVHPYSSEIVTLSMITKVVTVSSRGNGFNVYFRMKTHLVLRRWGSLL